MLEFYDRVLTKWGKNHANNTNQILVMNAVKTSALWSDDESLKVIWNEIMAWIFELLYENTMAQNERERVNIMKKLRNKQ